MTAANTIANAPAIVAALGADVLSSSTAFGELTVTIARERITAVLIKLRDDNACQFEILIDIAGVDYPARANRFDVVYHLLSPRLNQRIRVKLETNDADPVASVIPVFPAANWFERDRKSVV